MDAAFAVHPDMKSHTGAIMTMGGGAIQTMLSSKQKMNTRSSTEAELVAVDDVIAQILWTLRFLEAQGYQVRANVLMQDNNSAMKLESNGRASAGKRSRHLEIKHFYVTDQVERKLVSIEYCPTDRMVADYVTKALQGKIFINHRCTIMNLPQLKVVERASCHMMRHYFPWEQDSLSDGMMNEEEAPWL